ncbi:hybrid sensor histidine kinase/response regulator [Tautonia plasticadhaerens]|uniref:histidine kinase n=1 Tax=Tautonia plasticadhaerens TaxID=2527974 RepID=A0A518H003_9BACT|nr:hybrid sensor histidine kinase/response regulator [Tautonia plasticadhaerens]QDV34165.1 Sensor histidine kinase TodS [Tautonia plasticadhaerens]
MPEASAHPPPQRRPSPAPGRRRPGLLVVDDEAEVLRSLFDLFRLDYRVLTATRGAEALEILQEEQEVSVVMSDQRMPEMTGVEFLSRARAIRPEATRLLITGYADLKAVIDAINEGHVFRYVAKPWDPDELGTVIRQAVEHHDLIVEKQGLIEELRTANARLEEANRLKSNFIEVASHELNTPVTIVLGMAELWKLTHGGQPDDPSNAWIDRIIAAGRRLASTVERMVKLLHADRLAPTLEARPVELGPLLRTVVDDARPYLDARRQGVELSVDPGLGSAEIDREKVADALANLLNNAIKFTPDGGTIRFDARPDGGEFVAFEVSDQGVGIEPGECDLIFEPFFTGFDTMHHSSGDFQFGKRGIGLGLSLVRTFVRMHGGTVSCASEPGRGSTFRIRLPRSPLPRPPVDSGPSPADPPPTSD